MSNPVLDMSAIVNVVVNVSPVAVSNAVFNQGLIIGSSAVIPNATRLTSYQSVSAMIAGGFISSSPEVLAAQLYFSQSPAPTVVWIGLQDTTAALTVTINTGGTGYAVGDLIYYATFGITMQVTTVNAGVVTGINLVVQGTGASVSNTLATTTNNAGTGFKFNITAIGETPLQAVIACRAASNSWYQVVAINAAKADHIAIAAYIETAAPKSMYMYTTSDAAVLAGTAGNIFLTLQALLYRRSWGIYSTTAYAACAALGVNCGLNTGLANSAFTMMFKQLIGVTPEPLTYAQVTQIAGTPGTNFGQGGNVYVTFNSSFSILLQGAMACGYYLDQVLYRDMLSNAIQTQLMNLFVGNNKIPLTDAGVTQEIHTINQQCAAFVVIGYIAPGTWTGVQIMNLNTGDPMSTGYVVQAPKVSTLSAAQRAARQSPPIYVCIKEAGAIQDVVIGVYPQV